MFAIVLGLGVVTVAALPEAMAQGKKAVAATGTGTIKGKVILDGDAPKKPLGIDPAHKDAGHCMKGKPEDLADLTWVVGPSKELANVVVFLKAPAGQTFAVDMSKKTWTDQITIDQPFCAFQPHVSAMFAESEGKPVQKLLVKNSARFFTTLASPAAQFKNPAKGETLAASAEKEFQIKADTQVIKINCDAHKWMEAFIWAFDHPYFAVTDASGNFEIKNVPLGAEVSVMAWHEQGTAPNGMEVKKAALKDGDTFEFKIKKK